MTPNVAGFTVEDADSNQPDVARLAAFPPLEYDRCRVHEAKRLGVRVATLDKAVVVARGDRVCIEGKSLRGRGLELRNPVPAADPVVGDVLLNDLVQFFSRHLSLPASGAILLALWAVHTHCFERFRHTPRLAVRSPEKGCGKTTVLDLLEMVSARPLPTASVTAAAIFRTVEAAKPTLLIDEADTFLAASDELRGILNAGHKSGGQVVRCVGDDAEPRAFAAFAPAAIAAIGALPGTIQDRSVTLMMHRAIGNERPACITAETEAAGQALASRIARWLTDNILAFATSPEMPAGIMNRRADNWRPLFAIAALAGGDWHAKAVALAAMQCGDDDGMGLLAMLLADLKAIFAEAGAERLATAFLVQKLLERDDRPWPEMPGSNKPVTTARVTRMLKPVGAERKQWRQPATDIRVWGFYRTDLADAFARYAGNTGGNNGDVVTVKAGIAEKPNNAGDGNEMSSFSTGDIGRLSPRLNGVAHCKTSPVTTSPLRGPNVAAEWEGEL